MKKTPNKDTKIFGVDGNWYLHRVFHTQSKDAKDVASAMAYRFISLVCKDALAVKAQKILVAFDGPNVFRYSLSKDYKATRKTDAQDLDLINEREGMISESGPYDHLDTVLEMTASLGIPVVQYSQFEADDVLCSLAERNANVVVGCNDKDAFQYMRPHGLAFYNSAIKLNGKHMPKTVVYKDIESKMGVVPEQCLDLQTLIGDGVDNIPQIMPKAKAIKGIKKWGSIKNWLANDPEFTKLMRKNKSTLVLNRKLVALKSDIPIDEVPNIRWVKTDPTKLPGPYIQLKDFCNPKSKGLF